LDALVAKFDTKIDDTPTSKTTYTPPPQPTYTPPTPQPTYTPPTPQPTQKPAYTPPVTKPTAPVNNTPVTKPTAPATNNTPATKPYVPQSAPLDLNSLPSADEEPPKTVPTKPPPSISPKTSPRGEDNSNRRLDYIYLLSNSLERLWYQMLHLILQKSFVVAVGNV
jgi:hypothetical protein